MACGSRFWIEWYWSLASFLFFQSPQLLELIIFIWLRESMCIENRPGSHLILKGIILVECLIEQETRRVIIQASIMTIHLMKRQVVFHWVLVKHVTLCRWVLNLCCFSALYRTGIKSIKRKMDSREVEIEDEAEGKSIVAPTVLVLRQTCAF